MNKTFALKKVAKQLEPTGDVEDVLQMVLDGQLKLSVNFINPVYAKTGEIYTLPEQNEFVFYPNYSSLEKLTGIYDLAMIGNEKLDVQNEFWQQSGGQKIDFDQSLLSSNGVLVIDERGQYYQLQQLIGHNEDDLLDYGVIKGIDGEIGVLLPDDPENYEPRQYLPSDSLKFVVRESALKILINSNTQLAYDKPPATRHNVEPKEDNSLLNVLEKKDAWFEAINEMTNEFYAEHNKLPTETQAWNRLNTQPPAGYMITAGIDRGENCLKMEGYKPLGKKSFVERWKKYTKESLPRLT